ncbi:SfnB family sulfur acquisition oxidoreductase [Streptosporangium sp. NBC_01756]|uniref:SfnB family sulfur acquisition oxidoreductase n=1 Tax=Streptosporangium sp. NBC_01756 TaxID=2975950 RepID=UPI002DD7E560|nr:SfnB family sulfur acquisition oxidoreductase [Streptosporangium sp. NBC_01756]WSC88303.1 SfnB family sulfur acquisition oxidoreductase [Streptosporangium sp. NBC_01756]
MVHVIKTDEEAVEVARALARRFAEGAARRDAERILPVAEIEALSESGLLGITVPADHGGAGVRTATLGAVIRELAAADGSIGQIPQNHFWYVDALRENGTPDQLAFFYREVLAGRQFGNAAVDGRAADGSREHARLRPGRDGGFLISGRKIYSTGALFAHWIPVIALDDEERHRTAFVPRDAPGLTVVDDWDGMGQRTTASGTVLLEEVHVPADRIIAGHRGNERPSTFRSFGLLIHAAIDTGIAEGALADAAAFLRGYVKGGWPGNEAARVVDDPVVVQRFGELAVLTRAARALLESAGNVVDEARAAIAGTDDPEEAARWETAAAVAMAAARAQADTAANRVTSEWFELAGASASLRSHNLDRHWRNARTHTMHDPRRTKVHDVGNFHLNGIAPARPFDSRSRES